MAVFLQIIVINLVVSCDNVGVIALATQDLTPQKAKLARRMGIWLSLLLKLLFIGITGYLFRIPWLHIRIIGGAMLLYVTWNMLRQSAGASAKSAGGNDSFLFAMVSIVAADISMSLDNVIAILSIVSADGGTPDTADMVIIVVALAACVPVLLWFSDTVSRLMERYAILTYLCAGYLVFIAMQMIFEDETIRLFFQYINFTFAMPAAVLCGIFVVFASLYTGSAHTTETAKRRRELVVILFLVALYSYIKVGVISYLGTNPIVEGHQLHVGLFYKYAPTGANAVYLLGSSPFLFALCASLFVGIIMDAPALGISPGKDYGYRLFTCMLGMTVFIFLELVICTAGLWYMNGFGQIRPVLWLSQLLLQLLLHCTYASIFCMLRGFSHSRVSAISLSMLFILVENILLEIYEHHTSWGFLAGFLPDFYISHLPEQLATFGMLLRVVLMAALYIGFSSYIGSGLYKKRINMHKGRPLYKVYLRSAG